MIGKNAGLKLRQRIWFSVVLIVIYFEIITGCAAMEVKTAFVVEDIRREATLPNFSKLGRPLPLAAHWNVGKRKDGFSPAYQVQLIDEEHYLLPWFHMPEPEQKTDIIYYLPIKRAAELHLPISFVGTQWEHILYDDPAYYNLPAGQNPNVVNLTGRVLKEVSPFGPIQPWVEVGKRWAASPILTKIQEWYPDPPLVLFVSNNEAAKLDWPEVKKSRRFSDQHLKETKDELKRRVVGNGWIERYRALQHGIRHALANEQWQRKSVFIGYNAFGTSAFGRFWRWGDYSLYDSERIEPWPLAWDGASASYYVCHWNNSTDYTVWSPQIESMNWVFMLEEAYRFNPHFWFEISTWDGSTTIQGKNQRDIYARKGQVYTPERYGGMVQFGMWLLRPRVVREYRDHLGTVTDTEPYFLALLRAVDRVHNNPILRKFWRKGQLLNNPLNQHPYQSNIPQSIIMQNDGFC